MSFSTASFDSSTTWKLMKQVEQKVQEVGGVIFGGYPRDKIIHDHFAKLFYATEGVDDSKYSDVTYLPELALRTYLPTDIDIYMRTEVVEGFKKKLFDAHLQVVEMPGRGVYRFPGLNHTKMVVSFAMNPALACIPFLKRFSVRLDVITPINGIVQYIDPPFGHLDFECNGVLLTEKNEYRLCSEINHTRMCPLDKQAKLHKVIKDITEKTAIMVTKTISQ